jgi:hypothetical protein
MYKTGNPEKHLRAIPVNKFMAKIGRFEDVEMC